MSKNSPPNSEHKSLTLNDIMPGNKVTIRRHHSTEAVRQRLLDLGLMPETRVLVVRAAPLNDPLELRLDATDITLRRREAATIEVSED
ncbi:ferrous iron transport protein A [Cohaesibacter sp. ES.047]|uniref:FeoA family protein n=1 Tax=Cohaesibacter sp. ES.047 TaxID=1798205 RepID=UPI000BB8B042|nr:FeoA family protein [Cohaesibacter sp. ES.047]SNY93155.1 ferrous iron transport protein A [Cohaesibacter sp. ES.047]